MTKKRVLLVRLSSLGDVIFNLPLANILKKNGYEVTWIVSEKGYDVIKNNPAVNEAILVPVTKWKKQNFIKNLREYLEIIKYIRARRFDIAIDTQLLLKSFIWTAFCGAKRRIVSISARELSFLGGNEFIGRLRIDYHKHVITNYLKYANHLKLDTSKIEVSLPIPDNKIVNKIDDLMSRIDKTKPIIAIAPATTWVPKHWNKDNWRGLIKKIENDYTLVFTGTKNDIELISYISEGKHLNLAGKTNLLELAEIFRRCQLLISLDSGSTHLAWATQIPKIITIFCCTPPGLYAPIGSEDKYVALSGALPCQPCHKRRCPLKENKNLCTLIPTVDEVLGAVHKLLPIEKS